MAKKKQILEKYTIVCMRCQSPDVYIDKTNPAQPYLGLPPLYICNKCNFSGHYFPEMKISDLEKMAKGPLKIVDKCSEVPPPDINYGKFTINILWKFTGPFIIFLGIIFYVETPIVAIINILFGSFATYFAYRKYFQITSVTSN